MFSDENSSAVPSNGAGLSSPVNTGTNLSDNKVPKVPDIEPVKASFAGSLGVLVLIATIIAIVGTGLLYLYKTARISRLKDEKTHFSNLQATLDEPEMKKFANDLQEVSSGEVSLSKALDSKVYWSKFWQKLADATPATIYYGSMSVDNNGSVSIAGAGRDLTSVAKLMVSLQKSPVFTNVALGNTSSKDKGDGTFVTAFSLTFKVNNSELLKNN